MPISRRAILAAPLLAAPAFISARGQSKRPISFTLPWVAEGSNLVAYVAKERGYWDAAGLDVTISRGNGSVGAAQAIGAGRFDFGLAAASAGIQQAAKGLPVIAISCSGYDSTMGVGVLDESPIKTPKDLAGKTLACTLTSGEYPYLPVFFKSSGVDPDSVKIQGVDAQVRTRALIEKQADAISGYAISVAPVVGVQKVAIRFMLFSHVGLKQYNNMLLTTKQWVQKDPDVCKAIAVGLAKANRDVMLDPEAAMASFFKLVPEIGMTAAGKENTRIGVGIYLVNMTDDAAKKNVIGYSAPADYDAMIDLVMDYAVSPGDKRPAASDVFTNDFIGDIALTPAEWAKVETLGAPFKSYLS
jgi:NitT/TauT family transport system substrate-binding protein